MLTTLEKCQRELKITKQPETLVGESTADDTVILKRIDALVRMLESDQRMKNSFIPKLSTEYYDVQKMECNGAIDSSGILWLRLPLLSLTSLVFTTATNTTETINTDNVLLLHRGNVAKTQIKLINGELWPYSATDPEGAIAITGEWAYHDSPDNRWLTTNDTVQTTINATATEIEVDEADGLDYWLDTPRFSPGQLLKIDSEYVYVREVNASSTPNIVTVIRGQRGTTPAAHTNGTVIYVWSPLQAAQDFVTRAACLQYRRRGEFIDTKVEGVTEIHWPTAQTIPEYRALLQLRSVGSVLSG
jgi:hypothetical protein